MRYERISGILPLAVVLAATACAEVPSQKLDAAHSAQDAVMAVDAAAYAPEEYQRVVVLREELDTEMAVQAERYAILRNYDRAAELSDSLKGTADGVLATATTRREAVRQEATQLLDNGAKAVVELTNALAVAPVGKGTTSDLAMLRGDLSGVSVMLREAQTALDAGRYLEARDKAAAADEVLSKVRQSIDQARVMTRTT